MKKGISFILAIIAIIGSYTGFILFLKWHESTGAIPTITAPQDVLKVSVKDEEKVLLQGLTASDQEDGDLTSEIYVEKISPFDDQKCRTVTYAVFDSDDHLVRTTRQIQYTDYKAPEFDMVKSPYYYFFPHSSDEFKEFVSASSVVDGDLSSRISVDKDISADSINHEVTFSVTDSCGTKSSFIVNIEQISNNPNIDIILSDYLLKVEKGTSIDPEDYIESIELFGMPYALSDDLEIQSNYNPDQAGTYEVIYRISQNNGDYGIAKLLIIVEE